MDPESEAVQGTNKLRVTGHEVGRRSTRRGSGSVQFDYGARTVRVLPGLDEAEGRMVAGSEAVQRTMAGEAASGGGGWLILPGTGGGAGRRRVTEGALGKHSVRGQPPPPPFGRSPSPSRGG